MNRHFILSRVSSLKVLATAAWSWVIGYALPVLAQKQPAGTVIAAEVKGLPTHENSGFLDGLFTTINYITGFSLAGALIFGLIWLLQRRNVAEDAEQEAAAGSETSDSTAGAPESDTNKEEAAAADSKSTEESAEKSEDKAAN
jgi:flagellar biosynthesis/type III secretory pathway M-ring protein FliF/YscJ